jgi:trehalose synthase
VSDIQEVPVVGRAAARFDALLDETARRRYTDQVARGRKRLRGHRFWHINSTASGGGVAELLRSCLGYLVDEDVDVRWLVLEADPAFFAITKRIHARLHGDLGDGGALGDAEREQVERVAGENLAVARTRIAPGDVVVVHDPQPAAMIPGLVALGATVVWTCHVGVDRPNEMVRSAWAFLEPYVSAARVATFTRRAYVWDGLQPERVSLIPPCIDAFALKNIPIDRDRGDAILAAAGVLRADGHPGPTTFERDDGTAISFVHTAQVDEDSPVPRDVPLVVQVSRWDRLKDPVGVLHGFADDPDLGEAHLLLAGPAPSSVADDPEAPAVLEEVRTARRSIRPETARRVHLASLPADDMDENALIVNALQRRADVVVQKSLAEGFGLTVTEAMWTQRPVVASRVGGIQDQIDDGHQGRLVDPRDLTAFSDAVQALLEDPDAGARMGAAARDRVCERYLVPHYLGAYLELIDRIAGDPVSSP